MNCWNIGILEAKILGIQLVGLDKYAIYPV